MTTALPIVPPDAPAVLVLGGSGFIGSHLVAKLSTSGARVVVPTRHYERSKHLIFLPRVEVTETDIQREGELQRLMRGQRFDAVINLVGRLHSSAGTPYGREFGRDHVDLPRRVVAACAESGVPRYLHMSALGASASGPSMYLRSKAAGELAARANPAVAATIFRPSVVFGPGDRFLNLFASLQRYFPVMPLGGADARFQPVHVADVASAFVLALAEPSTRGQVVELGGPQIYTLQQLVTLAGLFGGHPRTIVKLPHGLAYLQALVLECLPGKLMSRDNLASMAADNVVGPSPGALTAAALGIKLTALEAAARHYLGQAERQLDDFRSRAGR
ncbi:complex I NDUFA9 subunit family protein [Janthinobacterium agaricidamnosum]|uniref:complex I NDUFA9 subunit family protein n=1 Tax=Janthinobacterium agaricidamnosum TaxID=55508 RepID=UPI001F561794|nr:complex I NDUFA9 subunit family protein [Janthinobacterium agaricidamnosum]